MGFGCVVFCVFVFGVLWLTVVKFALPFLKLLFTLSKFLPFFFFLFFLLGSIQQYLFQ